MMRAIVRFTLAQAVLIVVLALLLTRFVWTEPAAAAAVRASAWLAVGVQIVTFAIARLVARQQVVAAWGIGVLLRVAFLALWAFIGVKALALPAGPAMLSLVVFYFVSTLIEPLFLNS